MSTQVGTRENSCSGKICDGMKWGYELEYNKMEGGYECLFVVRIRVKHWLYFPQLFSSNMSLHCLYVCIYIARVKSQAYRRTQMCLAYFHVKALLIKIND